MQVIVHDNESQWHASRSTGVGASEAAAVVGVDEHRTPVQVWLEKTGVEKPVRVLDERPSQMTLGQFGLLMEPTIRDLFARDTGVQVEHAGRFTTVRHPVHAHIICTLDGLVPAFDGLPEGVLEIKNFHFTREREFEGAIPVEVLMQVQHQLLVTERQVCHLAVLFGGNTFRRWVIRANEKMQALLAQKHGEFWGHVTAGVPPPAVNVEDRLAILRRMRTNGEVMELSDDVARAWRDRWDALAEAKKAAEAEVKKLEAEQDNLKAEVGEVLREHELGEAPCGIRFSFKKQKTGGYTVAEGETRVMRKLKERG
jgi:putative phage-type endonuclease